jgi:hypothetical protein
MEVSPEEAKVGETSDDDLAGGFCWRSPVKITRRASSPTDHRPITSTDFWPSPVEWVLGEKKPGRQSLVEVDPEAGLLVRPHGSVPALRAAREHFATDVVKQLRLLDPEVRARDIEVKVGHMLTGETSPGPYQALRTPRTHTVQPVSWPGSSHRYLICGHG